jgi:hypothetical protein
MSEEDKKDLDKLTKTKLLEEAEKYPEIVGAHGMKKEELLEAIKVEKKKLGEEVPETPAKTASSGSRKKKKTPDRGALKKTLSKLKSSRLEALEAKDSVQLKRIRRRYKRINRTLRRTPASAA